MQELLQRALLDPLDHEGQRLRIDACIIGEKRYKPGKSFVLSYRLHVHDVRTGAKHEQVVSARLCRPGEGLTEFHRAKARQLVRTPGVQALAYLPEIEMVTWSFPNDRKLTHLPKLLDVEFLRTYLPEELRALGVGESNEILAVMPEILHYLPERSCMIRYRLSLKDPATGKYGALTIYGKNYRDEDGAEVYSIMQQLSAQIPGSAVPLGYAQKLRTVWQSHIPGEPFLWETLQTSEMKNTFSGIARCVAKFHSCTLRTDRRFDLSDLDESLMDTIVAARQAYPDFEDRIASLVSALLTQRRSMGWSETLITPIHRDLKMRNFLIDGEHIALIDMDCVCLGDPLSDLGSLIANFYMNGIRAGCPTDRIRESVEVFGRAYAESVPWSLSWPRVDWYTAAAFVHEVTRRSIRQLDGERVKHISEYLDLCERLVSGQSVVSNERNSLHHGPKRDVACKASDVQNVP
jgi:hypothetical protein